MAAKKKQYDADDDANEESALLGDASPIGSDAEDDDERTVVDAGVSPGGHDGGAESDDEEEEGAEGREGRGRARDFPPAVDPRFVMPTPAPWKRAALLVLLVFCFWLAFQIKGERAKPKVVHANRAQILKTIQIPPGGVAHRHRDAQGRTRPRARGRTHFVRYPQAETDAHAGARVEEKDGKGQEEGRKEEGYRGEEVGCPLAVEWEWTLARGLFSNFGTAQWLSGLALSYLQLSSLPPVRFFILDSVRPTPHPIVCAVPEPGFFNPTLSTASHLAFPGSFPPRFRIRLQWMQATEKEKTTPPCHICGCWESNPEPSATRLGTIAALRRSARHNIRSLPPALASSKCDLSSVSPVVRLTSIEENKTLFTVINVDVGSRTPNPALLLDHVAALRRRAPHNIRSLPPAPTYSKGNGCSVGNFSSDHEDLTGRVADNRFGCRQSSPSGHDETLNEDHIRPLTSTKANDVAPMQQQTGSHASRVADNRAGLMHPAKDMKRTRSPLASFLPTMLFPLVSLLASLPISVLSLTGQIPSRNVLGDVNPKPIKLVAENSTQFPTTPGKLRVTENSGYCETTKDVYQASGYGDIAKNKSIWFWYFDARTNASTAPLTLWFNGGPGSSSMIGLFQEHGPCRITNDTNAVTLNPYSWNNNSNMLYIDQPVGVGFSHGTTTIGTSEEAAADIWKFLQIFLKDSRFSHLATNHLALWTESYGGHYGPVFASHFLAQNTAIAEGSVSGINLNLKTLAIGNGVTYAGYISYASSNPYGPLIDASTIAEVNASAWNGPYGCKAQILACNHGGNNSVCSSALDFCNGEIVGVLAGDHDFYYVPSDYNDTYPPDFTSYLSSIADEIGAEVQFQEASDDVHNNFDDTGDWMRTKLPYLEQIVDSGIRVLIYNGDADFVVNYQGIENMLASMKTRFSTEFNKQVFQNYTVSGHQAGVYKNAGTFSYVRIFAAGHEVPAYQNVAAGLDVGQAAFQFFTQAMANQSLFST
ncbi:Alpha/Beta hydrolase protein [Mycena metata]|uniref:Carboxypeptidase n=1 Tax=Mycena metata TaxID=1033252 RepID=A0AAD7J9C3_9AGAR|nr:Alpha/Beta hydrolase protein [Mycena metata]